MAPEDIDFESWTVDQKLEMIEKLWDSIPPAEVPIPDWHLKEIERRLAEHEANPRDSIPADEFLTQLRSQN